MSEPIRHARPRRRGSTLWPLVPGVLVGMIVGVVIFAKVLEATR